MPIDLDDLAARIDRAYEEVGEIAKQGRDRWRMSIPAQPTRDSDLLIAAALRDAVGLLTELRAAREAVERLRRHRAIYVDEVALRAHEATCGDCAWLAAHDKAAGGEPDAD